jgi:hypothetical protein
MDPIPPLEPPKGIAVDALLHTRPGVPRERPQPDVGPHWETPEPQRGAERLSREGLRAGTPVFGTAQPRRGLSGAVRRVAYRIPEQRASRWALLVAGDRLDVLEHRLSRSGWLLLAALPLAAGYALVARALARR